MRQLIEVRTTSLSGSPAAVWRPAAQTWPAARCRWCSGLVRPDCRARKCGGARHRSRRLTAVHSYRISSDLAADPDVVWRQATDLPGVNSELMPLVRMTVPKGLVGARLDDLPVGRGAGRTWLLLFGVFPVDFDDLTIAEHGPGRRFLERSTMLTQSRWEHERTVAAVGGGCRVVDQLQWQGRNRALGGLYRLAVPILFGHRHRRLRRRYGVLAR